MKALCERIIVPAEMSWRYFKYSLEQIPFNWHYHPEYEICLTLNARGVRHIGDHKERFYDLDLVLLGPNLPHTWQSEPNEDQSEQTVYVAQIPVSLVEQWFADRPEFNGLKQIMELSLRGVKFSEHAAFIAKGLFESMEQADPLTRLVKLMQLLTVLRDDKTLQVLSSSMFIFGKQQDAGDDKLGKVVDYIYDHYTDVLYADQLAKLAHMSTNHFHRFFKQRTEFTLTDFINRLRIGKACKLLVSSNYPIAVISDQCGFNNVSNFNRRFLTLKGCTPSKYRQQLRLKSLI